MIINYGINKKEGKRIIHRNGQLSLPEITWEADKWKVEHPIICKAIRDKHPDWDITGYALVKGEKMEILIKDKEFHASNQRWADAMNLMRGQWIEVETERLFKDQFNVATARVHLCDIDAIKNDVRPFRQRCNWCGKHSPVVLKKCEHCKKSEYLERFFPKKKRSEDGIYS